MKRDVMLTKLANKHAVTSAQMLSAKASVSPKMASVAAFVWKANFCKMAFACRKKTAGRPNGDYH